MNQLIERTPNIIAAEINSIKEQTRTIFLFNSIEIGRRLVEAKSMIDHGEWGTWLEKSVDYSQRTAINLMRIFEEYGSNQTALFDNNAKSQALANLSYTQAVALLGVPEEDREQFVKDHDAENMTTRELQQAIKDRDDALKKLTRAKNVANEIAEDRDKLREEAESLRSNVIFTDQVLRETQGTVKILQDELEKERQYRKSEVDRLAGLLNAARANGSSDELIKQLKDELHEARSQVEALNEKLNEPVTLETAVVEKVPEGLERELNELREKAKAFEANAGQQSNVAIPKFSIYFDTLVRDFNNLLGALTEVKDVDTGKHAIYQDAVKKLIGKMSERL